MYSAFLVVKVAAASAVFATPTNCAGCMTRRLVPALLPRDKMKVLNETGIVGRHCYVIEDGKSRHLQSVNTKANFARPPRL